MSRNDEESLKNNLDVKKRRNWLLSIHLAPAMPCTRRAGPSGGGWVGEVGKVAVKTLHQRVSGAKMLLSPKKDPQQLIHMRASSLATQQCDPLGQNRTRVVN